MMTTGLFREKKEEQITSPEQLGDYIRVMNPGAWLVLIAVILLLISGFVWSVTVNMEELTQVQGIVHEGRILVYADPEMAVEIQEGMPVKVGGEQVGTVVIVAGEPVKRDRAGEGILSDYYRETQLSEWSTQITIETDGQEPEGSSVTCFIVTEQMKPFQFFGA